MISVTDETSKTGKLFYLFTAFVLISIIIGFSSGNFIFLLLPVIVVLLPIVIRTPVVIFYCLFLFVPVSIELYFGSFGTDFPSELLMILASGVVILFLIQNHKIINGHFFIHPISIVLYGLLSWMIFTAIWSNYPIISAKFIIAKSWYFLPFFIGPLVFCQSAKRLKNLFLLMSIPLAISVSVALVRHGLVGFNFVDTNSILGPSFRNHVIYAAIIVIFLPFLFFINSFKNQSRSLFIPLMALLLIVGLYFSYTRAAYLAFLGMIGIYFVIKWQILRPLLLVSLFVGIASTLFLLPNNRYLEFAPTFTKTIVHDDFNDLLSATARGEDASTMERVYRWVAAFQMIKERPITGFGPGNFYSSYKPYTLNMFRTYVSDNPDKSGIHSYYLMTLVEQGFIGLTIYLTLIFLFYYKAEKVYHKETDPRLKALVMSCIMSFTAIAILQLLNDLLETDKTGSFFFLCLSIIVMVDLKLIHGDNTIDIVEDQAINN